MTTETLLSIPLFREINHAWMRDVSASLTPTIAKNLANAFPIPDHADSGSNDLRQARIRWKRLLMSLAQHDTPEKRQKVAEFMLHSLALSPLHHGKHFPSLSSAHRKAMLEVLNTYSSFFPRPAWLDSCLAPPYGDDTPALRVITTNEQRSLLQQKKALCDKIVKANVLNDEDTALLRRFLE